MSEALYILYTNILKLLTNYGLTQKPGRSKYTISPIEGAITISISWKQISRNRLFRAISLPTHFVMPCWYGFWMRLKAAPMLNTIIVLWSDHGWQLI